MRQNESQEDVIRRLVAAQRIAVVGLSDDTSRPSYGVAAYLVRVGKDILPVNPRVDSVMGLKAYPSLAAIGGPIDLVDVFRRPEFCAQIAKGAVAVGAKGLWLQSGITSAEARAIADLAGMDFIENRCLLVEHSRFS